jgi:hypothetical protein
VSSKVLQFLDRRLGFGLLLGRLWWRLTCETSADLLPHFLSKCQMLGTIEVDWELARLVTREPGVRMGQDGMGYDGTKEELGLELGV